jgi:hypothetical protein
LDLHKVIGTRNWTKGLCDIQGKRGIIPDFEELVKEGKIKIGQEAGQELLENHIVIPFDLGIIVESSGGAIKGSIDENGQISCSVTPIKFPTATRYSAAGIDKHIELRREQDKEVCIHVNCLIFQTIIDPVY